MAKQVTLSFKESLTKLEKSLEGLTPSLEQEVNLAVKDVANAAYASIVAKAQATLASRRQDYLKGLQFEELGDNSFLISLEGSFANAVEEGFGPYDLKPGMLRSKKTVQVGPRAGQPWVQHSKPRGKNKESHKFAHVPMEVRPHSKAGEGTSNLADAVKQLMVKNAQGIDQRITQIFRNPDGSPVEGKAASVRLGKDNPLSGLVKYQKIHRGSGGKETIQSIYVRYRTVSERGRASWTHPGFDGVKAFEEAEAEVARQLDAIAQKLLK